MDYYIKERNNPQFKQPYYIACGKISKKEANRLEKSAYGDNTMLPFKTKEEYDKAIENFKLGGFQLSFDEK